MIALIMLAICQQGTPDTVDMGRWPNEETCVAMLKLNREWKARCEVIQAMNPNRDNGLVELMEDLERRWWLWGTLRQAYCDSPNYREYGLQELKSALGEDAFWKGKMPDAVPLRHGWR